MSIFCFELHTNGNFSEKNTTKKYQNLPHIFKPNLTKANLVYRERRSSGNALLASSEDPGSILEVRYHQGSL